jgi:hypothetical protein
LIKNTFCSFTADAEKEDTFEALKILIRHKVFWLLFGVLGIGLGAFNGLSTVSTYILNDFDCSPVEISWIGLSPIIPVFKI